MWLGLHPHKQTTEHERFLSSQKQITYMNKTDLYAKNPTATAKACKQRKRRRLGVCAAAEAWQKEYFRAASNIELKLNQWRSAKYESALKCVRHGIHKHIRMQVISIIFSCGVDRVKKVAGWVRPGEIGICRQHSRLYGWQSGSLKPKSMNMHLIQSTNTIHSPGDCKWCYFIKFSFFLFFSPA